MHSPFHYVEIYSVFDNHYNLLLGNLGNNYYATK